MKKLSTSDIIKIMDKNMISIKIKYRESGQYRKGLYIQDELDILTMAIDLFRQNVSDKGVKNEEKHGEDYQKENEEEPRQSNI